MRTSIATILLHPTMGGPEDDILATATRAGTCKTRATAGTRADRLDARGGADPFTVSASADIAFAKLHARTLDRRLEPGNQNELAAILELPMVSDDVAPVEALRRDKHAGPFALELDWFRACRAGAAE